MKATYVLGILTAISVSGCFDILKKKDESNSSDAPQQGNAGDVDIDGSEPLAALNLCETLLPKIPENFAAKGNPQTKESKKRSREACLIRQRVREAYSSLSQMALDTCLMETQKGIKAGGKYRFKFPDNSTTAPALTQAPPDQGPDGYMPGMEGDHPQGQTDTEHPVPGEGMPDSAENQMEPTIASVYLDNSDPDHLKVYSCSNDKLVQKVSLKKAGEKGSLGTYKAVFSSSGFSIAQIGSFDNGVGSPDRKKLAIQMLLSMTIDDKIQEHRSNTHLDLSETGVSVFKIASESFGGGFGSDYHDREIGVALLDQNVGSALFQRSFKAGDSFFPQEPMNLSGNPDKLQVETSRAYYDASGMTLEQKDSVNFKEGGILHAKEDMFPKMLPEDFKVEFEPGDWDCIGAVDVEPEYNDEYKKVEEKVASLYQQEQCEDDTFGPGTEEDIPPFIDQREEFGPPDFDEELPPPPAE